VLYSGREDVFLVLVTESSHPVSQQWLVQINSTNNFQEILCIFFTPTPASLCELEQHFYFTETKKIIYLLLLMTIQILCYCLFLFRYLVIVYN